MYRRAQNVMEVAMLASFVIILSLAVLTVYNNQKKELANLSMIRPAPVDVGGISNSVTIGPGNGTGIDTAPSDDAPPLAQ